MKKWRSPHDGEILEVGKQRALLFAIVLSLLAFSAQLVGGFYTGSIALLGDAAHLFTDLFSLVISLVAVRLASRPTSGMRSFGLYRLEVLASFINALLLLGVTLVLAWESLERILHPTSVLALPLLGIASAGLVFNLISALVLFRAMKGDDSFHHHHHGHDHSHDHADSHDCGTHQNIHEHKHHEDRNLRSALLHMLSDALGSLAVIIGAIIIYYSGITSVDAWIGLLLTGLIGFWSVRLLLDTTHVLLESTPKHIRPEELLKDVRESDKRILAVEDVHVWEITSRMYAATGEIIVSEMTLEEADLVRCRVLQLLEEKHGVSHAVFSVRKKLFLPEKS